MGRTAWRCCNGVLLLLTVHFVLHTSPVLGAAAQPARALEYSVKWDAAEVAYDWSSDKCDDNQIPDSPVRAFRTSTNSVVMVASHYDNKFFIGETLKEVRPSCSSRFSGKMDPNPKSFDARVWLQTFFTEDGKNIYALGSSDYHASWFGQCKGVDKSQLGCWQNAIVLANSSNSGESFSSGAVGARIIAKPPEQRPGRNSEIGYFSTSNIVKRDGYYYTLIAMRGMPGKKAGNCLARTDDLSLAPNWRYWNGREFSGRFLKDDGSPEAELCHPISLDAGIIRSLLWHTPSEQFIAVYSRRKVEKTSLGTVLHISFIASTSKDLLTWSEPSVIADVPSPKPCDRGMIYGEYPSIIDPESKDRNFGTIGDHGYLFFTRFNGTPSCQRSLDRDLIRVPISIK